MKLSTLNQNYEWTPPGFVTIMYEEPYDMLTSAYQRQIFLGLYEVLCKMRTGGQYNQNVPYCIDYIVMVLREAGIFDHDTVWELKKPLKSERFKDETPLDMKVERLRLQQSIQQVLTNTHLITETKRKKSLQCQKCQRIFGHSGTFNRHINICVDQTCCPKCYKTFATQKGTKCHIAKCKVTN